MHDGSDAVEVDGLEIRYGDLVAVRGISFTAAAGRVTALLGPNGAGKTSTIEALEGYRTPAAGQVRVLGLDPRHDRRALVPRLGVMLQEGGVYTGMRPPEALRLFASYYPQPRPVDELLDRVGLRERRRTPWRHLSGGEQQRLSLALALVGRPEVVLLDEPTAGVDPVGRTVVRDLLAELRADGVCVLLTSHDLDEVERLADHVVIIDDGRVVGAGSPDELMRSAGPAEVRFAAAPGLPVADLSIHLGVMVTEERPGEYVVAAEGSPAIIATLTAWLAARDVPLGDLRAGRQRLEDVFLRLTAERSAAVPDDRHAGRARPGRSRR